MVHDRFLSSSIFAIQTLSYCFRHLKPEGLAFQCSKKLGVSQVCVLPKRLENRHCKWK